MSGARLLRELDAWFDGIDERVVPRPDPSTPLGRIYDAIEASREAARPQPITIAECVSAYEASYYQGDNLLDRPIWSATHKVAVGAVAHAAHTRLRERISHELKGLGGYHLDDCGPKGEMRPGGWHLGRSEVAAAVERAFEGAGL